MTNEKQIVVRFTREDRPNVRYLSMENNGRITHYSVVYENLLENEIDKLHESFMKNFQYGFFKFDDVAKYSSPFLLTRIDVPKELELVFNRKDLFEKRK